MADGEQFTVYDAETQQPLMVTVSGTNEDGQNIAYISQDTSQQVSNTPATMFINNGIIAQQVPQTVTTNQNLAQRLTQPTGTVVTQNTTSPVAPISQMLFLNQVNINGQTSFVLVDASNTPVQLPHGIKVINLPQSSATNSQSMAMPTETGEEPLYVNAKQYHRILKRRQARAKLEAHGKIPKERQKYMYESRHKHALKRQRGLGGVFVGSSPASGQNNEVKPELHMGSVTHLG